jgi:hypothetical protein
MVILMFGLVFTQFLYGQTAIIVEPDRAAAAIYQELTERVARIVIVTFIISVGIPDAGRAKFKLKNYESIVFAGNYRIELL